MDRPRKHRRKAYQDRDDLTGEYAFGDTGQLILAAIFMVTWVADSFVFGYSTWLSGYVPAVIRIVLALAVLLPSGLLALFGLKTVFVDKRDSPSVITAGVFSLVRHPIYLAAILAYLGMILLTFSLSSALVWLVTIVFYYWISKYEEKLLLQRFKSAYKDYMKRVPMLFPLTIRNRKKS
jgi:protein-S-isoprenylcysteine O-methyltransferase Ste14